MFPAHLGFLFGTRLLMLEHVGRSRGQPRGVVLEVVDRQRDAIVVAAGFGEQAHVSLGLRVPVTAARLTEPEAAEALRHYASRRPRSWAKLKPVFERTLEAPIDETGTLPLVRLTPTPCPPDVGTNAP